MRENYKKQDAYEFCDRIYSCDRHNSRTLGGNTCFFGDCAMSRFFIKFPNWGENQTKQEEKPDGKKD